MLISWILTLQHYFAISNPKSNILLTNLYFITFASFLCTFFYLFGLWHHYPSTTVFLPSPTIRQQNPNHCNFHRPYLTKPKILPFAMDLPFPHRVNPPRLNGSKDVITVLGESRWGIFSAPLHDGRCNKAVMEQFRASINFKPKKKRRKLMI